MYCISCGQQLPEGAKFCSSCGKPLNQTQANKRSTVFDGTIYKCVNCGQTLTSFTSNCPSCGYELRDAHASNAVKELSAKLEEIEKSRPHEGWRPIRNGLFGKPVTKTDEQKIALIQSFAIPNTKEDLYEFFVLSKANIDIESYEDNGNQYKKESARRQISNAWKSKFDQAYEKSIVIFQGDENKLNEIKEIYNRTNKLIKKAKAKGYIIIAIAGSFPFLLFGLLIGISAISDYNKNKNEVNRLNSTVTEIETSLNNHDYEFALMNSKNLTYNGPDKDVKREWKNKQEYWINKTISEAEKDGIVLNNPILESLPKLEWLENKYTKLVPDPKSEYGKLDFDLDTYCEYCIYNYSENDYEKYKNDCIKHGFTNSTYDYDSMYMAKDDLGNKVSLIYDDAEETMKITIIVSEKEE